MSADSGSDPLGALRRFVERVSPYDPGSTAGAPVIVRCDADAMRCDADADADAVRCDADAVTLTPHLARAFVEALERYRDPADRGACAACGGRLDEHLHCPDCDRFHGVFGELVAERARRATGTWPGTAAG